MTDTRISHRDSGVPDLTQWLETVGVDLTNENLRAFVEEFVTTQFSGHDTRTQIFVEFARTYCVATVEVANVLARRGIDTSLILASMARAAAFAMFNASLSIMKEETPTGIVASFLTEELIFGMQAAAAEHERCSGRDGSDKPIALGRVTFDRLKKGRRT